MASRIGALAQVQHAVQPLNAPRQTIVPVTTAARLVDPDADPLVARVSRRRSAPSDSCRSRPASRPRASGRGGRCRPATAGTAAPASAPISRSRAPRSRITGAGTVPAMLDGLGARTIGVRKHVQVRQRRRRQVAHVRGEVVVGLARETRRSCPTRSRRAAGGRRCRRPAGGSRRACTAGACARAARSLACCSGRWKCGAKRPPLPATSATISGVQSIGSSELTRNTTSARRARRARAADRAATPRGCEIAPVRAEVHAGERDFLEARRGDPLDFADDRVDRQAAPCAARGRDDAVGAALLAAGLHAQREGGPAGKPGRDRRAARPVAAAESLRRRQLAERRPTGRRRARSLSVLATTRTTLGSAARSAARAGRVAAGDDDARRRDCRGRCGGSSGAHPGRRSPSPNRC